MPTNAPSKQPIGGLYVQTGEKQLVFPLKHTEVQAKITGNVSRVEVTQTFENPFTEPLEAVYVFPLPHEAAVDDMEIALGDRIIKGRIKKREEAQAIYEQARREGRTAGLLEQERDNVFTQSLANIKPGEAIDVTIRYTDSLKFEGGDYEFVFPMVVGPRFIPGMPIDGSDDTDRVPDASRITPPVVLPSMRSGHDIGVTVEIDAGVPVSEVRSPSHQIRIEPIRDGMKNWGLETGEEERETLPANLPASSPSPCEIVRVKLGREDTIPNKDLIVRYRVAGENTQATVLSHSDERGNHFALYLIPALDYRRDEIVPKDVVFLMDTSGSQMGDPLLKSQELMRRFIKGLNSNDTFTIIDFSNITTRLSSYPLPNTPQNRQKAIDYINQLQANGGTYLLSGIQAVVNFPAAPEGRLRSIVLLTDGYIGNENEVLAEIQQHLQPGNRLYSFGVGSSPNRFLLNRLAELGRGTCQIVRPDEPTEEVAETFFRQINNPVLTNIQVNWDGMGDAIIYPSAPPDLFAQQPLVLFGRISPPKELSSNLPTNRPTDQSTTSAGTLQITGTAAGGNCYAKTFNLTFEETGNPAIAQLWGRARIKDLMNQMFCYEKKSGVESITETALTYQLLSQYTAFVAVSKDVRVDPEGNRISMEVPVEIPEGVSHQGIFGQVAGHIQTKRSRGYSVSFATASEAMSVDYGSPPPPSAPLPTLSQPPTKPAAPKAAKRGLFGGLFSGRAKHQEVAQSNPAQANAPISEPKADVDIPLISPDLIQDAEENQVAPTPTASHPNLKIDAGTRGQGDAETERFSSFVVNESSWASSLQVVSATGLDEAAIADLTQHLQQLELPSGFTGEIVFEFPVRNGRVGRVVVDEDASILKEIKVIDLIKRSLASWRVPQSTTGTVRLMLRLQS